VSPISQAEVQHWPHASPMAFTASLRVAGGWLTACEAFSLGEIFSFPLGFFFLMSIFMNFYRCFAHSLLGINRGGSLKAFYLGKCACSNVWSEFLVNYVCFIWSYVRVPLSVFSWSSCILFLEFACSNETNRWLLCLTLILFAFMFFHFDIY
jgi:hypothetical protein